MRPRELFLLLFLSSRLPKRCVGPRDIEPSLWGPLELGLWSQCLPCLPLQLGFHLCFLGWLANGSAAHPVVFPAADCGGGQVGVVSLGIRKNRSECWDAYCYREQDVACRCRHGFVGDGTSMCNGKLLDVLAATANFSTFYGVCRGPALGLRVWVAEVPGEGACSRSYLQPPYPDAAGLRQCHPSGP